MDILFLWVCMAGKKMGVSADQHSDEHGVQRLFNVLIMYKTFRCP